MPAPLSSDLRRRVHDAALAATAAEVATRFGVSMRTVYRLRQLVRRGGTTDPRAHGGGRSRHIADEDRPHFEAYLAEDVSTTHAEMATRFASVSGRVVTRQTVQARLAAWGITRKKNSSAPPSETAPT